MQSKLINNPVGTLALDSSTQDVLQKKQAEVAHWQGVIVRLNARQQRIKDVLSVIPCVRELEEIKKDAALAKRKLKDAAASYATTLDDATAHLPGDDLHERLLLAQNPDAELTPLKDQVKPLLQLGRTAP